MAFTYTEMLKHARHVAKQLGVVLLREKGKNGFFIANRKTRAVIFSKMNLNCAYQTLLGMNLIK